MSERGRVCLFATYLWPQFADEPLPFAGGAETQQAGIARGLARAGFDVVVATCDFGQGRRVEREGITFIATHPPFSGIPVLRFFHPRMTGNLRALNAADADVYYARAAGLPAGIAYDVARARGAAFVYAAAHDTDAERDLPLLASPRDRWWYKRALLGADAVIAQTQHQHDRFRSEFGRDSVVIPNLVEMPREVSAAPGLPAGGAVVWLSTYKDSKRPGWFIELARRHPESRFVMVGVVPPPPLTPREWEQAQSAARGLPNLEVRGHLEHGRVGELFREASLFVQTSSAEGFPNTLLEAWAHGVPAITAFDPDGVVAHFGLGEVASTLEAMDAALTRWIPDPATRGRAGRAARAYVDTHHAPDAVIGKLAGLFDRLIAAHGRNGRHVAERKPASAT